MKLPADVIIAAFVGDRRVSGDIVTIGQRRVMLAPVNSEWLYCLNLLDGQLLWKCRRQPDDLYVACVDDDKVAVVGRHAVRAVRLADGKPAWDGHVVDFPDGGTPSGLGVLLSGGQYLVPLSNNEIVGVDIATGKIRDLSKSRPRGLPGNLICHQGKLISEGVEGVDCYSLADAARTESQRRLAANPNDAEALSLRGEVLLDAGKRSEAVASLRRAYAVETAAAHSRVAARRAAGGTAR